MTCRKVTDQKVKFCVHINGDKCNVCAHRTKRKYPLPINSFHQIKQDITVFIAENETEMIVDIGCPNSVISVDDVRNFKSNLTKFQKENLQIRKVVESFKFGPSGPYKCSEKLRIPIKDGSNLLWVEVAIVDAKIPMLLGKLS